MKHFFNIISQANALVKYMIFFALAVVCIVWLIELIRRPWFMTKRIRKACEQAGLHNAKEELPVLHRIQRDRNREHGIIIELENKGISIPDFDNKVPRLEAGLNGKICSIEPSRRTTYTRIYFLPQKYVRPTVISPSDSAIGSIDVRSLINMAIVGATGTGKTVLTKILMAKISRFTNGTIWIVDPKQFDFQDFANCPHYYGYTDAASGINAFYEAFVRQKAVGIPKNPQYLFVDEWSALLLSREKKEAEQLKAKMAELLMTGRSYQYIVICCQQRASAELFAAGARDQFRTIISLGNLSKEQKQMLFSDYKDKMVGQNDLGEGYLLVDVHDIERIKVEEIKDFNALNAIIMEALDR